MASRKRSTKTEARIETRQKTLDAKTEKAKAAVLERLAKTPIVEAAVKAEGVGRSTYYKWRNEDSQFAKMADIAISESRKFVNDIALSKLMQLIDSGHITAIIFWLKNNHEWFSERVWHQHMHMIEKDGRHSISPDKEAEIKRAMSNYAMKIVKTWQDEKRLGRKMNFDPYEKDRQRIAEEKEKFLRDAETRPDK